MTQPRKVVNRVMRDFINRLKDAPGFKERPSYRGIKTDLKNLTLEQCRLIKTEKNVLKLAKEIGPVTFRLRCSYFRIPISDKIAKKLDEIDRFNALKEKPRIKHLSAKRKRGQLRKA